MNSAEIRQSFVDFFVEHDHLHQPSAPLVPHGDATLLFTNAGMVQWKNCFLGQERPPQPRVVTAQKCLRVSGKHNDLENVGPSPRHHTFFEMLGNFSFGDYFKELAIELAWELVTERWQIQKDRLYVTVFEEDDEAHDLWLRVAKVPADRVLRCGSKDNFWAMGDTGPCGPCSEIFIDRSPKEAQVSWQEGTDSGRYLEIWNLVFMQFNRGDDGVLTPLPNPSIDTGAGLERLAAALQGVDSNYDTDLFAPILEAAANAAEKRYGENEEDDVSLRVIADHIRAVGFLLADGVIPANEDRGYVLRRLLRRAVRHGLKLGFEEPFLGELLPALQQIMGDVYPELGSTLEASRATIHAEEEKFLSTLARGSRHVQMAIEEARRAGLTELDGKTAFSLYDTYGVPLDSVIEIAEEERFTVDEEGFAEELERQRQRSRGPFGPVPVLAAALEGGEVEPTEFRGYGELDLDGASVLRLVRVKGQEAESVSTLGAQESGVVVLDRTVFYAESGGQVGDVGLIEGPRGRAEVRDTQREGRLYLHTVVVSEGSLETGDSVHLVVDAPRRRQTERHHTATHLLHAALRQKLGEGVRQAGSLVHPDRLRFDFTYGSSVEPADLEELEDQLNAWIRQAEPVLIAERSYQEAIADGAMALFGEKYGDVVRTVEIPGLSLELCGGCHVRNCGEIGGLVVVAERSVASGVRRIEALAGTAAQAWHRRQQSAVHSIEAALGTSIERAAHEIENLKDRVKEQEKELSQLRLKLATGSGSAGAEDNGEVEVGGVRLLTKEVPAAPANELRSLADVLRSRLGSGVVVLVSKGAERISVVTAVTPDLAGRIHAGQLAKRLGDVVGGSGGGRADFAQAGGKELDRVADVFRTARETLSRQLGGVS